RDLLANAEMAAIALLLTRLRNCWHGLLASRLTGLAPNDFAGVANAFPLVRLRRTKSAKFRGDLTHERLVRAVDHDLCRGRCGELDALGRLVLDRVGVTEGELQSIGTHLRLVADPRDLELFAIAL